MASTRTPSCWYSLASWVMAGLRCTTKGLQGGGEGRHGLSDGTKQFDAGLDAEQAGCAGEGGC